MGQVLHGSAPTTEAARTADAKQARRILAIWCRMSIRMDRQTLRDWMHRDNTDGLAGLADLGRQPRLAEAQSS